MAVFRVNKSKNYTCMSNTHLQDKRMSLRAKGLLSMILSLPDSWDYSKKGLLALMSEGERVLDGTLAELKQYGYLVVDKVKPMAGNNYFSYVYNIYEAPCQDLHSQGVQVVGLQDEGLQLVGVQSDPLYKVPNQLSTNRENTEVSITKSTRGFAPPTLEEVTAYCSERNNNIDAQYFLDYYTARGWELTNGRKVKDWKACVRTWEQNKFKGGRNGNREGDMEKAPSKWSKYDHPI